MEVGDNYLKRYIPIFQPLEVQMMMAAFTNMETVHIDAYALLLKTLGMPQTEFEAFRDYDEMKAKADYMHTFGVGTCADVARTLAMFGAFTEGMSLFASFAMLMNFPRFNKMNGMGQIVSWSVRDESLHCEGITKLYHAWNDETGCVTKAVRDDIREVAHTMVGLEEGFVDLAFSLGEVQGMTAKEIKSYVRYIADWRLTQLKLEPVFGNFEVTETGYKQLKAASAALAGGNPQRRRARQLLRAARHRIFQGRVEGFAGTATKACGRSSTSATRSRRSKGSRDVTECPRLRAPIRRSGPRRSGIPGQIATRSPASFARPRRTHRSDGCAYPKNRGTAEWAAVRSDGRARRQH